MPQRGQAVSNTDLVGKCLYVTESPLPPKFWGDVLGFLLWKSLVLAWIARSASEEEKFVVLLECTEGRAHDLVDSFISCRAGQKYTFFSKPTSMFIMGCEMGVLVHMIFFRFLK